MQIEQYVQQIAFHAGIIIALVQIIKLSFNKYVADNFYPLISFILGLGWGLLIAKWPFILSMLIGLVASGVYDLGKRTYKGIVE